MEKINWTEYVKHTDVLQRVREEGIILHTIKGRKAKWIGHMLRGTCCLNRVTERKIEGRS